MRHGKFLFVLCVSVLNLCESCRDETSCRISRIHGMRSADCYDSNFRKFPKCLGSNVEIIELSMNRLRKVYKDDLENYSNLKMLYLPDNVIATIDEDAFADQSSLTTLDISMNPLTTLPTVIFQLPSLKSLYMSQMVNMNIAEIIEKANPITSPLVHLDISSSELDRLPNFGVLPTLTKYNISGNDANPVSIAVNNIAGLCKLAVFDTENVTAVFEKDCDCWNINRWLHVRKVKFTAFKCLISEDVCPFVIQFEDMQVYRECEEMFDQYVQQSRLLKIGLPIGVVAIVLLLIVLYFLWRRRQKHGRKQNIRKEKIEGRVLL